MFLFMHGLAILLSLLMGNPDGSRFSIHGGAGAGPMDGGGSMPGIVSPADGGGSMPGAGNGNGGG